MTCALRGRPPQIRKMTKPSEYPTQAQLIKAGWIEFTVPGEAKGKARPRFVRKTGHVFSPDTGGFQTAVAYWGKEAGLMPTSNPVSLYVVIKRMMPSSFGKAKKARAIDTYAIRTPDVPNIMMGICDGLEGTAYHDDKQVVHMEAERVWNEGHKTIIYVKQHEEMGDQ